MSIARAWYIRCDNCGNPAEVSTESGASARDYAQSFDGFIRRGRRGRRDRPADRPPPVGCVGERPGACCVVGCVGRHPGGKAVRVPDAQMTCAQSGRRENREPREYPA